MNNTQENKPQSSIKAGDIFQLGNHILQCGDATSVSDKMFESPIKMILTDPPYGVAYSDKNAMLNKADNGNRIQEPIIKDELQTEDEYANFSNAWLKEVTGKLEKYNIAYIFISDLNVCSLRRALKELDWYYSQTLIWVKNTSIIGRKDYMPQHELIVYGWYQRHKAEKQKEKSVLFYPKPNKSRLHPTMKPVGLLRRLILNSTRIGDTVYDPFGGSGSTLIACEHTSRKCRMVELDPGYCEVIIKRWEKLTGKKAVRL